MSQKRKRGLQRGLSEIVERQTAPVEDKSRLSRGLIDKFADPTDQRPAPDTPATQRTLRTQTTHSTQGTRGRKSVLLPDAARQPVAPARDYMKVANSIGREAVPAGVFTGKGKLIYDYLYSRTRGAIVPVRSVQVSRKEIMKAARVGSDKTLRENLLRLRYAGLITWDGNEHVGAHAGNVYTVYLPEEARETPATLGTQGTVGSYGQFLPSVPTVESTLGTGGVSVEDETASAAPKTLIKTNTENDDDELRALREAARELTGRNFPPGAWREVVELLTAELKLAAGRTTVSSPPAFLAEHLRRRLWKKDKAQLAREENSSPVARQAPEVDASKCPDCFGTGMWYPEGFEKGVAKCQHQKLKDASRN